MFPIEAADGEKEFDQKLVDAKSIASATALLCFESLMPEVLPRSNPRDVLAAEQAAPFSAA